MGLESLFLFTLLGGLAAGAYVFETCFQRTRKGERPWLGPLVDVVLYAIGMIAAAVFCAVCSIKELSLLTEVFQISRTVKHLPFFLSGMVLRYYYPKLKEFFDRRRIPALCLAAAITAASALCFALQLKIDAYLRLLVTSYVLMALLLALANALPENCRALAQTGKMSYQIMPLDPFYKVVLFAAAGKLFGGMPLALLPLIAAADFALGVITCMVIRKIPGVRILFGL